MLILTIFYLYILYGFFLFNFQAQCGLFLSFNIPMKLKIKLTNSFAFRMIGLILAVSFWLNVTAQSDIRCPTGCRCIMKTVRCSRAGLTYVPPDLPQFAEVIDLRRVF